MMAAVSICSLMSYFADEPRSISRGENHYKSSHIEAFRYSEGTITGTVHASMKDKVYKATVHMSDNDITSTECDCPRGGYKCSHSAALFIYGIHNLSATDVECVWKKPKAPTQTRSVSEMYPVPEAKRDYVPLSRETDEEDKLWLTSELRKYGQFTGISWLLAPEPPVETLPVPTVEEIILSPEFLSHDLKDEYLLQCVKLSEDNIQKVNKMTVGQRDNPNWHLLRKGRLTASNFGSVLKAKRITPSLIKRVLGEYDLSGLQAIQWGVNNEAEAVKKFEQTTGHRVIPSGLWLDTSGVLGASPDGLIGQEALLEVKCPYSARQQTISDACNKVKGFCLIKKDTEYELKPDHVYFDQVQGQMYITDRKVCFFTVWTLVDSVTIQIEQDVSWKANLDKLKDFYRNHMLPKIIEG